MPGPLPLPPLPFLPSPHAPLLHSLSPPTLPAIALPQDISPTTVAAFSLFPHVGGCKPLNLSQTQSLPRFSTGNPYFPFASALSSTVFVSMPFSLPLHVSLVK